MAGAGCAPTRGPEDPAPLQSGAQLSQSSLRDVAAPPFLLLSMSDVPDAPAFLGQVFTLKTADGGELMS
jgi:hypothetical protein